MQPPRATRRAFLRRSTLLAAGAACLPRSALFGAPGKRHPLFDGKSLAHWKPIPRSSLPPAPGGGYALPANLSPEEIAKRKKILANSGRWTVENGVVIGGQEPPGSGLGAYLLSEEKFGDFELEIEANPDWCADTGIMLRAGPTGAVGWQLTVDHRPNGSIGGIYGNGIGSFRCFPFVIDAEIDANRVPVKMLAGTNPSGLPLVPPHFSAPVAEFLRVWKPGGWNRIKARVVGAIPTITTWINDVKMCEVDAAKLSAPGYAPAKVAERLGPRGHLALEVHNNDPRVGNERWWPGAVCRWRNAFITEL